MQFDTKVVVPEIAQFINVVNLCQRLSTISGYQSYLQNFYSFEMHPVMATDNLVILFGFPYEQNCFNSTMKQEFYCNN